MGFPGAPSGKESACQCRRHRQFQSLGREDPLEEEMATHSSILDWTIPWTEEPGRLQSRGSKRVRYDWATEHSRKLKLDRIGGQNDSQSTMDPANTCYPCSNPTLGDLQRSALSEQTN